MAGLSLFPEKFRVKATPIRDATISDFTGGLNLVDNDLTMKSRYAKVLDNLVQGTDGSLQLRWGTKFFCDVSSVVSGDIIETVYFNSYLVVFTTDGEAAKIAEDGTCTAIWNTAIAAALVGTPAGWATGAVVGSIDTTEFKGELIVVNGVDKPLIIHKTMAVEYLNDPATGSNVNTPIAKYVTTVSNFTVMAGVGADTDVYFSSQGTSGVWVGDLAPNDSVVITLGSYVPQNSGEILGIASFRNFLIVAFDGAIVVVAVGAYDDTGAHVPAPQDNIIDHGIINFRTFVTTKNDLIMADTTGWHGANKNTFGLINTDSMSELIDPEYTGDIPQTPTLRKGCFAIHNKLEHRVMLFVPNDDGAFTVWVNNFPKDDPQKPAWSTMSGWSFTSGCNSARGRIFLSMGTRVFQYGNAVFEDEDYTADELGNYDTTWATLTYYAAGARVLNAGIAYLALANHTSGAVFLDDFTDGAWEEYIGEEIPFEWELPWSPVNARALKKFLKYFRSDTTGTAAFTVEFYCDNYYRDSDNNRVPQLSMDFVAGDSKGYGDGDQPFGGGRRMGDERPWGTPAQFNLLKLRIFGSTRKALKFISHTIYYTIGQHRR